MSTLPEGWEWDYDGTRWLYRYKPSGLIQYHFPKPGDEFPEYVGYGVDSFDLEPEERLASDMQMKRRDTQSGTQPGALPTSSQRRKKPADEIDEIGATGYFDPEGFMFLGPNPGGYADTDATSEQETDNRPSEMENTSIDKQSPCVSTQVGRETRGSAHGSGLMAAGDDAAAKAGGQGQPHLIPRISGQLNPVPGSNCTISTCPPQTQFFAELASHDTRQCADELAPIELDASQSFPGAVLAELSSESASGLAQEKSSPSANARKHPLPSVPTQPTSTYPLVSASFAFPPLAKDSGSSQLPSEPSVNNAARYSLDSVSTRENASFQAWKPGAGVDEDGSTRSKRSSLMPSGSSLLEFQQRELSQLDQRRYSFPAKVPASAVQRHPTVLTPPMGRKRDSRDRPLPTLGFEHSPVPAVLRPANQSPDIPPKIPLVQGLPSNRLSQDQRPHCPGSKIRDESVSSSSTQDTNPPRYTDLSHCPSVLKPANYRHGRPHAATISGNAASASDPKPMAYSPSPLKESGHPPLRMPDSPDYDPRPLAHRVSTMPSQLPSQSHVTANKTGFGPGFVVFHEISPGKDPLGNETTQGMEAQDLAATERPPPVELSSDFVKPTNLNVIQDTPEHNQQTPATSQNGDPLQQTSSEQCHSQSSSTSTSPVPNQSFLSTHANETAPSFAPSTASRPPTLPAAINASQLSETSYENAISLVHQASGMMSSISESIVKPNQSSQTISSGHATSNSADVIDDGSISVPAAAEPMTTFIALPHKPAAPGPGISNEPAQHYLPLKPHSPFSALENGPADHDQVPGSPHAAPQGQGTIQGSYQSKPPSNTPSLVKPQQVHAQQSLITNMAQPPASNEAHPAHNGLTQQAQQPPQSFQKPPVATNSNTVAAQEPIQSSAQQPNGGAANNPPMRPDSQYSQYPSPPTQPASVVQSQISSPAVSIASLCQTPSSAPTPALSSPSHLRAPYKHPL
ncbi:uncharacterized protein PG998_005165 [Apiospora kogelbergensis]|uniref:uncharacterized protein n=1 Tax=Apiospora kogelbergensis TaxID=1337665 RepID=UPI00312FDCD8